MSNLIVFLDEKSKIEGDLEREMAVLKVKQLISVIRSFKKVDANISVNTERSLRNIDICNNWTIGTAMGGNDYKDEWDFLRFMQNRAPLSHGVEEFEQSLIGSECEINSGPVTSTAAQLAHILDSAIFSLDGAPPWGSPLIEATFSSIDETDGTVTVTPIIVRNANKVEHVVEHRQWLDEQLIGVASSIEALWNNKTNIFESLILLDATKEHLSALGYGTIQYYAAISTLKRINKAIRDWNDPQILPNFETKTTSESGTRLSLCNFWDETLNREENFAWHSRFTGNIAGRIHFRMDKAGLIAVVAYIGKKL